MSNGKRAAPFSAFSETILGKIWADVKDIVRNTLDDLKKADKKRLVLMNLPYVALAYVCNKIVYLYRISEGISGTEKVVSVINHFDKAFANPLPSLVPKDVLYGIAGGIIFKLIMYYKAKNAKKFRHGVEYGSARWGNAKDIKPYVDPVFENNIILTQTEFLMMSGRPKQPKYARNKNVLVVGGSGSGKTRFFIKPNLMQMHSSYVVTDPKGYIVGIQRKLVIKNV